MSPAFTPRDFWDSALLLTVRIDTDLNGIAATGTGFLCQVLDGDRMAIALISNRHVFRDGQGSIELRFHSATKADSAVFELGQTVTLAGAGFTHRYVPHPSPGIDLAAAVVNAVGKEGKGLMLAADQIAESGELEGLRCGEGVAFVGYPTGWRDELHNLPLMRRGWISSLPSLDFDGRAEFVIDAQAFPGSSGSPVFAQIGDTMRLIGVLAETRTERAPVVGPPTILEPCVGLLALVADYKRGYPAAMAVIERDLDALVCHLRFPSEHRKRIRSTNLLERTFVEVRRRTKVIGRFPGETSALALIWAVLELTSRGWRGVVMTPRAVAEIERLRRTAATDRTSEPSTEEVVAA